MTKAPLSLRLLAFLIDHILIILIGITVIVITFNFENEGNIIFDNFHIGLLLFFFLILLYFFRDIINGSGPGKTTFGLKVVSNEFSSENKLFIALRNITVIIWPLEFLVIISNHDGKRISDYLFNTSVVAYSKNKFNFKAFIIIVCLILTLIAFNFIVFGEKMRSHPSFCAIEQIVKNDSLFKEDIGGYKSLGYLIGANCYGDTANYHMIIKGNKRNRTIYITLVKDSLNIWRKQNIEIIK